MKILHPDPWYIVTLMVKYTLCTEVSVISVCTVEYLVSYQSAHSTKHTSCCAVGCCTYKLYQKNIHMWKKIGLTGVQTMVEKILLCWLLDHLLNETVTLAAKVTTNFECTETHYKIDADYFKSNIFEIYVYFPGTLYEHGVCLWFVHHIYSN